ncbi:hypothetical protein niasHT_012471 [Heterodera trifolii]|uniref:Uncharacterized protein n=1 Tax=Heterodera trifolii TaxID=157864 RepID=A0ABD2KUM1_9BILA
MNALTAATFFLRFICAFGLKCFTEFEGNGKLAKNQLDDFECPLEGQLCLFAQCVDIYGGGIMPTFVGCRQRANDNCTGFLAKCKSLQAEGCCYTCSTDGCNSGWTCGNMSTITSTTTTSTSTTSTLTSTTTTTTTTTTTAATTTTTTTPSPPMPSTDGRPIVPSPNESVEPEASTMETEESSIAETDGSAADRFQSDFLPFLAFVVTMHIIFA